MGILGRLLGGQAGDDVDADRLAAVVGRVPGVTSADLRVESTGGAGRSLRGELGLPDAEAEEILHAALAALSEALGPEPRRLALYVEGVTPTRRLTTADAGLPLNPSSVQLWRHLHGGDG